MQAEFYHDIIEGLSGDRRDEYITVSAQFADHNLSCLGPLAVTGSDTALPLPPPFFKVKLLSSTFHSVFPMF